MFFIEQKLHRVLTLFFMIGIFSLHSIRTIAQGRQNKRARMVHRKIAHQVSPASDEKPPPKKKPSPIYPSRVSTMPKEEMIPRPSFINPTRARYDYPSRTVKKPIPDKKKGTSISQAHNDIEI